MYWAEKIENVKSSYDFGKSISSTRFWNEFWFFEPCFNIPTGDSCS